MTSVVKCKKGFKQPIVNSEEKKKKELERQRMADFEVQLKQDFRTGRRESYSGRINPLFEDD